MPSPLTIPGVQVRTQFEPAPVLPGATGVLGIVGITERGPLIPTPVATFGDFVQTFGASSRYTMPELRTAFTNGVSMAYVARLVPGRAVAASATLFDDDGGAIVRVQARSEGAWGNGLAVRVTQIKTLTGLGIKYVNLEVLLGGNAIETHQNLVFDPSSPNYFFDKVNNASSAIVVTDAVFGLSLPKPLSASLARSAPVAASAKLSSGAATVLTATAKATGEAGNQLGVRVRDGRGTLTLAPSVVLTARAPGADAASAVTATVASAAGAVTVTLVSAGGTRNFGPFAAAAKAADVIAAMANDPEVTASAAAPASPLLPIAMVATKLSPAVDVDVAQAGGDTRTYAGLTSLDAIAAIDDPLVTFAKAMGATALPDTGPSNDAPLTGGRTNAPALFLSGDVIGQPPLLELLKASNDVGDVTVTVTRGVSTIDNATPVVGLDVRVGPDLVEQYTNLTMDPESDSYLPRVLQGSQVLRARDLYVAEHSTAFPAGTTRAVPLTAGTSPSVADYQTALENLESAEPADLIIASVNGQLKDAGVLGVQQAVVAHCTKMADVARNRIGIGSVTGSQSNSVPAILDHADNVRSDYFVLTSPAGSEGAFAGLLGRQDYFQSPTFKTIAAPDFPAGTYTDAQLTQLINGNVVAINMKHGLGIIVIKGLLTSGRQINVQRTANKAVRDVKAICDVYIGLLNNDGARNALKQQITAMFLQMQRDGAIVPSTDGLSPAFGVDVYATQNDFALGIVRVDVAMRPVRAIDYIYCTLFVKN